MTYHYYEISYDGFVNVEFDPEWAFVAEWDLDLDELTAINDNKIYIITEDAVDIKQIASKFKETLLDQMEQDNSVMNLSKEEASQMLFALDEVIDGGSDEEDS